MTPAKADTKTRGLDVTTRPPSGDNGERKVERVAEQAHAVRVEFSSRPQRPIPDTPGAVGERASGKFLSEIVSLAPGRYRARVQIVFSELAKGEPIIVKVRSLATGHVFDEVRLTADLNNRAVADEIYLSFFLDRDQAIEFDGWAGGHCETTLLRLLTILDDPLNSVVASDFAFPAPTRPSIRDLKEVSIGSTGVCNASCVHCPTNKKGFQMPHGRMDAKLFEKLMIELAEGGFTGQINFGLFAEPLEDPMLLERLKSIKSYLPASKITIATNAALYDPKKHYKVMEYVDSVAIHIESMTPDVYDHLMHPLKSARTIPKVNQLIEDLRERNIDIATITTPVHKANFPEIIGIAEYARDLGVAASFTSLSSRAWEGGRYNTLSIAPTGGLCRPSVMLDWLFVDFDGLVLPCCFDFSRSLPLGNLNHQSIDEVFAGEAWRSMFDTFRRGEWSSKGPCSRCRSDDAKTILRLVDGLTASPTGPIRQIPAGTFKRGATARRNDSGFIVTDREAPDGCLFWGPYVRAERGRYRVRHDIQILASSAPCALEFDVCVDFGNVIARKRIDVLNDDDFEAALDFEHDVGELLEFRIYKSGDISFAYKGACLLKR